MRKIPIPLFHWMIPLVIVLLTGCNNEAFVDRLKTSVQRISLSADGGDHTVRFSSPSWKIYSINTDDLAQSDVKVWFGDRKGNIREHTPADLLNLYNSQPDRIFIRGQLNCTIERDTLNGLHIVAEDNLMERTVGFDIRITDGLQYADIRVEQSGSAPFALDSVSYRLIPESFKQHKVRKEERMYTNEDIEVYVPVVADNYNFGRFKCRSYDGYFVLPDTTLISTPLRVSNGKLVMGGGDMYLISPVQMGRLLVTAHKKMKLKAGRKNRIVRITAYQTFVAEFTVFTHSLVTGKKKNISGQFACLTPLAEDSSANIIYE